MVPFKRAAEGGGGLFSIAGLSVNMTRATHSACVELKKSHG